MSEHQRQYGPFGYERAGAPAAPQSTYQEDYNILQSFIAYIRRTEPDAWVDETVLEVEREDGVFVRYEDPSKQHRSYSPRIFAVSRREGAGGFHFEEV